MLLSPKRMCIVTRQTIPSAFMINLRPVYFPSTNQDENINANDNSIANIHSHSHPYPKSHSLQLLPDRLITPGRSKTGKGMWVSCHRDTIAKLHGKGPHTGILKQIPSCTVPRNIRDIVHAQLLERTKSELINLVNKMNSNMRTGLWIDDGMDVNGEREYSPVLTRLTMSEWKTISSLTSSNSSYLPTASASSSPTASYLEESGNGLSDTSSNDNIIALLDISNLPFSFPSSTSVDSSSASLITSNNHGPDPLATLNAASSVSVTLLNNHQTPLYDLSVLFPKESDQLEVLKLIKKALSLERKMKLKSKEISKNQSSSSKGIEGTVPTKQTPRSTSPLSHEPSSSSSPLPITEIHSEIPIIASHKSKESSKIHSNIIALHTQSIPTHNHPLKVNPDSSTQPISNTNSNSSWGIPLFMALWKLRCYSGEGWTTT
ncbi:uncharacterized protein IL334_005692 [Kwoniella shivajii]|uniref:HTH APSES-type domain-containing protein n=1 Tax=Kwoniella shivajii TaxID=564305 RepID=A0ABZ1D7U0_9TREE|nr:hypothetical protein IL334_005692 [Kwoniella shivajii]